VTGDNQNVKIIQTVASGGTAVLYKGIQVSLDRVVAVKRLHPHLTTDENFTRRFILEAKAAASLDHENIVRVIDFGVDEDCYQIVMEYVEGESLKEVLERWRPIICEISLALVHQICRGLEHAHSKGIVHRDIKPGNVMITNTGSVKITDFGLAKLTHGTTVHTAVDSILGTPLYMSPEQAIGESVDQRSDLFSLGTVLYELLTGKQPFTSENYMGVIQNIINKEIPNVCEVNPGVPNDVEALVAKALARKQDERFQSAREFRQAIETVMGADGLARALARIPALLERGAETRVMANPTAVRPTSRQAPLWASTSSAMARPKRSSSHVWTAIGVATLVVGGAAGYYLFGPGANPRGAVPNPFTRNVQGADFDGGVGTNPLGAVADTTVLPAPETAGEPITTTGLPATSGPEAHAGSTNTSPPAMPWASNSSAAGVDTAAVDTAASETAKKTASETATETRTPEKAPEKAPEKPKATEEPERFREGYLGMTVEPSGQVYVDGVYRGMANPSLRLTLNAGIHRIECRGERFAPYTETLRIVAGELSRRTVIMQKLKGIISLATTEGAELYIDGSLIGVTPIRRPIEVEAGTHTLTIKKENFYTWTSDVTIEANATLPLRITLSPRY
jgi:serine/threonine protein kinase